ncbi:MAG: GlsB/YeaQ/YmgE family stress response membrane protein [Pirellulales bacterium]|nr:GlsB/YeaQ/YmgE family stress response membrane protein [Pirellulales bacterium]
MNVSANEIIVWVIIGALSGSFVGMLATRSKEGYGKLANLAIGMAGAVVGGLIFKTFDINLGLRNIKFTAEDLVAAILGAIVLLLAMWLFGKVRSKKKG